MKEKVKKKQIKNEGENEEKEQNEQIKKFGLINKLIERKKKRKVRKIRNDFEKKNKFSRYIFRREDSRISDRVDR